MNPKSAFPNFYNNDTIFVTPPAYSILKFQLTGGVMWARHCPDLTFKDNSRKITTVIFSLSLKLLTAFPGTGEHKVYLGFIKDKTSTPALLYAT